MKKNTIFTKTPIAIGMIAVATLFNSCSSFKVETAENNKVIELQQQQLITGSKDNMTTSIRYLVITDKETFICETSVINGKFDNSNIFFHLKKDSTYTFKVEGYGKSMFYDYRNILEIVK
jgi:hypothetical protein